MLKYFHNGHNRMSIINPRFRYIRKNQSYMVKDEKVYHDKELKYITKIGSVNLSGPLQTVNSRIILNGCSIKGH